MRQEMRDVGKNNQTGVLLDSLAWDAMIRDAKKRIEELECLIEVLEKKKAAGERWPGVQSPEQGGGRRAALRTVLQFPAS